MNLRFALFLALSVLLLAAATVPAAQLDVVVNGGLEPPLSDGWQSQTSGVDVNIASQQLLDPDFDYEVLLTKGGGTGYGRLAQTVSLPVLDTDVSVSLLCDVAASGGAWAAGGLMVQYLDQGGAQLGQSVLLQRSADCPWIDSNTSHFIDVEPGSWKSVGFNVDLELDNLPGVPRDAVRKLGLVLFIEAADC